MAAISVTTFSNAFSWRQLLYFDENLIEICSPGSNERYSSIGSDNGSAPVGRQAIIWTNDDHFTDAYMRHSASMS